MKNHSEQIKTPKKLNMQKRLIPTLRENKRYILLKDTDKKKVNETIMKMIGIMGYAEAGVKFVNTKKFKNKELLVAVNREKIMNVRAALTTEGIKIIKVSGTIKGLVKG
ncbi:hypothetical protein COU61_02940 [Candidatus Pacearchaeota archaeon CG10_big_fil_rev_8_21_14_0_10_35_13]|nr:MAG: hypothetical protein COU61_02940 [Candidatus Pacearchaeota archaeon CG10_big_fil_rev_8_21_14_0_10_35_13]